ncbi:MAG: GWxTD domain-containing protein [Melioribacteraceae bacterium]|nr:GWxTD domain-containing protein [Melioribacteraceae bacterium]
MKYSFVVLFFITSLIFAQIQRTDFFVEHNIIASDSGYNCYVSIRVPYNTLVFTKNSAGYSSGFEFRTEISSDSMSIVRKSIQKDILVTSFEETNFRSEYLQAVLEFKLNEDDYLIQPYLSLKNSNLSRPIDQINERLKTRKNGFVLFPIVFEEIKSDSCKNSKMHLVNFGNSIPYSSSDYSMFIPINDTSISKVKLKISQSEKTILENEYIVQTGEITFAECDGNIKIILNSVGKKNRFITVNNFSNLLDEGSTRLSFLAEKSMKREYDVDVTWSTKPRSLFDPEFAIRMLKIIEPKEKVDSMLSNSSSDYKRILQGYWSKYNRGVKSPFNYLMAEFYNRVDEAMRIFTPLGKMSGAETDRGKVFVRFGKPDKIERVYNGQNSVLEIWKYIDLDKEYIFKDDTGIGNYYLIKK